MTLEKVTLDKFIEIAKKYGYPIFSRQVQENKLVLEGNVYFQFGDLRVETEKHHVIVEVEGSGGVTNLAKYWYCIKDNIGPIKKPLYLLHLFYTSSKNDYGSHRRLWTFLNDRMREDLGNAFYAEQFVISPDGDFSKALETFEKIIVNDKETKS